MLAETGDNFAEEWDLEKLWTAFRQLYPIGITPEEVVEASGGDKASLHLEFVTEVIKADALERYEERERQLGEQVMRELERRVVMSVLDRKWREHLYEMDYLREGIGLRAMASRDPLVEYQREGFELFKVMMEAIREESVGFIFNVEVQVEEGYEGSDGVEIEAGDGDHPHIVAKGLAAPDRPKNLQYTAPSIDGEGVVTTRRAPSTSTSRTSPRPTASSTAPSGGRPRRRSRASAQEGREVGGPPADECGHHGAPRPGQQRDEVFDRQHGDACGDGGGDARGGVLDRDAVAGVRAQQRGRPQVRVRVGLGPLDLVARDDRRERAGRECVHDALGEPPPAHGHQGTRHAERR